MKLLLSIIAVAAVVVVGNATAGAKDPPPPECQGNPHFCHGGDTIEVTSEPAGENCPNGGIKIVVTHPVEEPEPVLRNPTTTTTTTVPEPPEPEVETFFICNGEDGLPGEPGSPGIPGPTGAPGGTVIGPSGFPTVTQTTTVNVSVSVGGRGCHGRRGVSRLVLPQRMRSFSAVSVKVDQRRARTATVRNNRSVRVRVGRRCGSHIVQVSAPGVEPTLRLWTVTRRGIHKAVLTP